MFDLGESQREAITRLSRTSTRQRRSDAGRSRLPPVVLAEIRSLILGMERPPMVAIQRHIANVCAERGLKTPSRATLYAALLRIPGNEYDVPGLPRHVRESLYNVAPTATLPGHQLAFYGFNYGSLAAASYAAGLPWLDLYQAARLRGWRPRSFGLLMAAMRARGIT